MRVAGIIVEYNPMHCGHVHLLEESRRLLGPETGVVCVMSGDFVQRGDFAVVRRQARAEAAVRSGADLVLELPLPWAVSSAERFADGGVQALLATGLVTHLVFGGECGDADTLMEVAACLDTELYQAGLRRLLGERMSFAACRQAVVEGIVGKEKASVLKAPNSNLGVEYCKALLRRKASVRAIAVPRLGAAHDSKTTAGAYASASAIRALLAAGERARATSLMAPAMGEIYLREEAALRAPVFAKTCERAILARLRSMSKADFAALDEGREGLYSRLYEAGRAAVSVADVLEAAKTKRYAHARLRRMVLWAYLGLRPAETPEELPYLRVLAANETGRALLSRMRQSASVPVVTKPSHISRLSPAARDLFAAEARAADLYALAYPDLAGAAGGSAWREGPVILR